MIHSRIILLRQLILFFPLMLPYLYGGTLSAQQTVHTFSVPDEDLIDLEPSASFESSGIKESSGIVKSQQHPNVFWTHNDSGNRPYIFPITLNGKTAWETFDDEGVKIHGAVNKDWEEICYWKENIIIADIGNNLNKRRDLLLYLIAEPALDASLSDTLSTHPIAWPDQHFEDGEPRNFDCEAVFSDDAAIYFLTKHRGNTLTSLYKLDTLTSGLNVPEKLCQVEIGGMVTAADFDLSKRRLAILTYNAVWVFTDFDGDDFFSGNVLWLPITARQCEAITFIDSDHLLITNEQEDIFQLSIDRLIRVK